MPEAKVKRNKRKRVTVAFLFTLLLLHCLGSFYIKLANISSADGYRADFIAYYTAAALIERGETTEIYVEVKDDFSVVTSGKYFEVAKQVGFPFSPTRFLYLPIFATPFRLLTQFPFATAARIWLTINLICIFFIIYLEWYFTKGFLHPVQRLVVIAALNLYSYPLLYALTLGQTSILIYLIICLIFYFTLKNYEVLAGIFLGIITALKFSPLLFIIYFLYRKKYKLVSFCFLTIVSIFLASLIIYGIPLHGIYFDYLMEFSSMGIVGVSNQSIEAILLRLFTQNTILYYYPVKIPILPAIIRYTLIVILLGSVYRCIKREKNSNHHQTYPLEFSAVALCMLLIPSISWLHYFSVAILSIILISAYYLENYPTGKYISIPVVAIIYAMIAFHPDYTFYVNTYGQGFLMKLFVSFPFVGTCVALYINLMFLKDQRYLPVKC